MQALNKFLGINFFYNEKSFYCTLFFSFFNKMFTPLAIISSILYIFLIYTRNQIAKYIVKPTATLLIIGVALESSSVRNDIKIAGKIKKETFCSFSFYTECDPTFIRSYLFSIW